MRGFDRTDDGIADRQKRVRRGGLGRERPREKRKNF